MRYAILSNHLQIKNYYWLSLSLLVIIIDQLTKSMVANALFYGETVPILPFLNITLAYNSGSAFSFLAQAGGWQIWFFSIMSAVISSGILVWLYRLPSNEFWHAGALSLILGGALGNLIDRLRYGHVIDFIQLHINSWSWPDFNMADSAICLGAFILVIVIFRKG